MSESTTITPRDRVVAAYKGQRADLVPAYPIAGSFAGCLDGLSIEEYCTNPKKAVKAMINYYDRYQPDIMIAFNDLAKEVEAVGCHVKYSDYVVPSIDQHVLQDRSRPARRAERGRELQVVEERLAGSLQVHGCVLPKAPAAPVSQRMAADCLSALACRSDGGMGS